MILELLITIMGLILVLVSIADNQKSNLAYNILKGSIFVVGVFFFLGGIWNLVAFNEPIEICSFDSMLYSIDENNNVVYRGYGTHISSPKFDSHKYRYVYFCSGGGSNYNITETSKDGEQMTVLMKPFWGVSPDSLKKLSNEQIKDLVDTYGVDWPQKFLKPSEDWIRNYIRNNNWKHIITPNSDWEERLRYERKYSMEKYGFYVSVADEIHLVNHEKEEAFWDNRNYATLAPIAAAYGVELEKPKDYYDVEEYVLPVPTPKQYTTYYDNEGNLHADGLYSDGIYYNSTEELLDHLKNEHENN